MPEPSDTAAFRKRASAVYNVALVVLAVLFFACIGVGGYLGGVWGGIIGAVVGFVVAGAGTIGATLLWAMSQDGA